VNKWCWTIVTWAHRNRVIQIDIKLTYLHPQRKCKFHSPNSVRNTARELESTGWWSLRTSDSQAPWTKLRQLSWRDAFVSSFGVMTSLSASAAGCLATTILRRRRPSQSLISRSCLCSNVSNKVSKKIDSSVLSYSEYYSENTQLLTFYAFLILRCCVVIIVLTFPSLPSYSEWKDVQKEREEKWIGWGDVYGQRRTGPPGYLALARWASLSGAQVGRQVTFWSRSNDLPR